MLAARDVSVRVRSRNLLHAVSLAIAPGELVTVVGPNGAGKSTLLKVLSGEVAPTLGEVTLEGRRLHGFQAAELARRRAVLRQNPTLAFSFPVIDVVLLGRTPHAAFGPSADLAIARAALRAVDAADLEGRLFAELSGGEQQRVHLARVLAQIWEAPASGGRYLMLDEPTASLDLAHQHSILATARRLAGEGVGVVVVLHDLNLAARYGDRIAVLDRGTSLVVGPPAEILSPELVRQVFATPCIVLRDERAGAPVVVACPDGGNGDRA